MARSQNSFIKKKKAEEKKKKKNEKFEKRLEKKSTESSGKLEDMMAYVDENGNLSDTPPVIIEKKVLSSKTKA
jgi:uncharacterized protein YaaR (DUF327 family)